MSIVQMCIIRFFLCSLLICVASGTVFWTNAWVMLLLFFGLTYINRRHDPLYTIGQPTWDRNVVTILNSLFILIMVVSGIEYRFHNDVHTVPMLLGVSLVLLGYAIVILVHENNPYAIATVEKPVELITDGPYKYVRHPMYVGTCLIYLGTPVILVSWIGFLLGLIAVSVVIYRLLKEEIYIETRIAWYCIYRVFTPYRLIPHIW